MPFAVGERRVLEPVGGGRLCVDDAGHLPVVGRRLDDVERSLRSDERDAVEFLEFLDLALDDLTVVERLVAARAGRGRGARSPRSGRA